MDFQESDTLRAQHVVAINTITPCSRLIRAEGPSPFRDRAQESASGPVSAQQQWRGLVSAREGLWHGDSAKTILLVGGSPGGMVLLSNPKFRACSGWQDIDITASFPSSPQHPIREVE